MLKPKPFIASMSDRRGRRPYRVRFLLIVLMTVVTLVVGMVGLVLLKQRFISASGEAVAVVAPDIADSLDLFMVERYGDIQILADVASPEVNSGSRQGALFATVKRVYPSYLWIGVANADGRIVDALDRATVNRNVRNESWFEEARKTRAIHLGDVSPDRLIGGLDAVSFSKSLFARSDHGRPGDFLGVVTTRVGLPALEEVVTRVIRTFQDGRRVWGTVEYQVLRSDGQVFIDSNLSHQGHVNLAQAGLPSAVLSALGQSGYIEGHIGDGMCRY